MPVRSPSHADVTSFPQARICRTRPSRVPPKCSTPRVEPTRAVSRPKHMRRSRLAALALLVPVSLAGCSSQPQAASDEKAPVVDRHVSSDVPSVVGLPGSRAVGRLRSAGYENIAVKGRWSHKPQGTILAQSAGFAATQGRDAVIHLVASRGTRDSAHGLIDLPGVATCELSPLPAEAACAGGPVILWAP